MNEQMNEQKKNLEKNVPSETLLHFWFSELSPQDRFARNLATDAVIRQRFGHLHAQAVAGEIAEWRSTLEGRLAEIILLDQFSRNLYRDDARAFQADAVALALSQEALLQPGIAALRAEQKTFLYMPFMHSESQQIHTQALLLFSQPGLEDNLKYELRHQAIIARFGRYPHRNALLGRVSTSEEIAFLQAPGSGF